MRSEESMDTYGNPGPPWWWGLVPSSYAALNTYRRSGRTRELPEGRLTTSILLCPPFNCLHRQDRAQQGHVRQRSLLEEIIEPCREGGIRRRATESRCSWIYTWIIHWHWHVKQWHHVILLARGATIRMIRLRPCQCKALRSRRIVQIAPHRETWIG